MLSLFIPLLSTHVAGWVVVYSVLKRFSYKFFFSHYESNLMLFKGQSSCTWWARARRQEDHILGLVVGFFAWVCCILGFSWLSGDKWCLVVKSGGRKVGMGSRHVLLPHVVLMAGSSPFQAGRRWADGLFLSPPSVKMGPCQLLLIAGISPSSFLQHGEKGNSGLRGPGSAERPQGPAVVLNPPIHGFSPEQSPSLVQLSVATSIAGRGV